MLLNEIATRTNERGRSKENKKCLSQETHPRADYPRDAGE